jgi:hypothetical protein
MTSPMRKYDLIRCSRYPADHVLDKSRDLRGFVQISRCKNCHPNAVEEHAKLPETIVFNINLIQR